MWGGGGVGGSWGLSGGLFFWGGGRARVFWKPPEGSGRAPREPREPLEGSWESLGGVFGAQQVDPLLPAFCFLGVVGGIGVSGAVIGVGLGGLLRGSAFGVSRSGGAPGGGGPEAIWSGLGPS